MKARAIAIVLLTVTAGCSLPALAQSADEWQFQVILYGYLPKISGTTDFALGGVGGDLTVHPDTILKNLNGVFMGMAEASRGPWGVYTDLMYLDVGNTQSGTRDFSIGRIGIPASVSANLDFNVRGTVWTVAGTYQVVKEPGAGLQVVAGARLLDVDQRLGVELNGDLGALNVPGRQFNVDASVSDWDGIVGVKGRLALAANANGSSPITSTWGPVNRISPGRRSAGSATRFTGATSSSRGATSATTYRAARSSRSTSTDRRWALHSAGEGSSSRRAGA